MNRTAFILLALLALSAMGASPDDDRSIAPNTVTRAFEQAERSVVKLYGSGIGREHGYGTGFLVSADGKILTTRSLLIAGRNIRAVLSDGKTYDAKLVRVDEYRQLALLKIEGEDFPYLPLTATDDLMIGDAVIAIGNWFKIAEGHEPVSVSRGILSLRTNLDARRLAQDFDYRGPVLVVDAITSNPGAPGGPLLDVDGRCVGVIGRVAESAMTNTRINYALPTEEIEAFLGEDSEGEAPATSMPSATPKAKPYIGIKLSKLGYRHVSAYVERVASESPAAAAGVKSDDLIVGINGRRIADAADYRAAVDRCVPGEVIELTVKRGRQLLTLKLTVGSTE